MILVLDKLIGIILISCIIVACDNDPEKAVSDKIAKDSLLVYDSLLAQEYGADERGMKKYVIAFLKNGPKRDQDSATSMSIQEGHMKNIRQMAEDGKLVLAGPFFGQGEYRGIYVFNVNTIEEAEALTRHDPAIKSGRLEMELKEWYGSAALMAVNEIHQKLIKPE